MIRVERIVRTLCKYFLPRPKKMTLSSKVIELRKELLQNCESAIDLLEANKNYVTAGYAFLNNTSNLSKNKVPAEDDKTYTGSTDEGTTSEFTDDEAVKKFMILTHGVLIQEWDLFLRGIFAEGVIYYLRGYDLGTPKFNLKFKELKQTTEIVAIHENIASEAKESLYGYEDLFQQSCNLFKLNDLKKSELGKRMKKHILVRHVFQHHRGEIRNKDIEKNRNESFSILNDEGKFVPVPVGETIYLSLPEIQNVYDTIKEYSEAFQKQAENAEPIKVG